MGLQSESAMIIKGTIRMTEVCERYGIHFKHGYAPCPFHDQKSGSFCVNPKTQKAKCFSCGWTGDMFDLVGKMYGLDVPETIKKIAGDFGIRIPLNETDLTPVERNQLTEKQRKLAAERELRNAMITNATRNYNDALDEFARYDRFLTYWGPQPEFGTVALKRQLASMRMYKWASKIKELEEGE